MNNYRPSLGFHCLDRISAPVNTNSVVLTIFVKQATGIVDEEISKYGRSVTLYTRSIE